MDKTQILVFLGAFLFVLIVKAIIDYFKNRNK